ncbi:family S53 protease-like protein [Fomitiporia mediterranea MF3/22]|uniref:family S53 protease-like protein n=1 Tax=Fomitiporia mediterranea (strain MF3/22) TaxID=694068 RepID=UPI00044077CE|nr:family S53 protease-like protein [Fomitiporia mediterranea MF3/22]EJD00678.1 family S53 protease-like protein [Fomitiporia mediterranea MF3/22]
MLAAKFAYLVFASFVAAVSASPLFSSFVLHEQRTDIPDGFVKVGSAPADQVLNLRLALVNNNMNGLEEKLYAVSTPGSALYGQHLSKEEVEEFVKPSQDSINIVNQFLSTHGITATVASPASDWLTFSVPVSKANDMFQADFSVFQHEETGKQSVRTLAYSIPTELQGHLNLVHPTITFENPFAHLPVVSSPLKAVAEEQNLTTRAVPSSCASTVTPACLQAMYGIPTTKATQSSSTLGVSGFIEQFANSADLQTFLKSLRPDLAGTTFSLQTLDGGSNPQSANEAGVEANLDIQYTVGVASGVPTTFISVGERFQDGALEGFLDIINFLLGESNPPHVLTTSYGQNENTISSNLANQLCNAYMQLGARGTSILFASGDGGVSGSQSGRCTTFLPTFPSGCPFMTSVGATTGITETAADFSSGGFSNIFSQPSYQTPAVSSYLNALGSTNSGKFNPQGRAFPDISAQGENVEIVVGGETGLVAGTSCSSPIFASVISLLNDRLVAAGRSPLGFLNPFLYGTGASALNDITTGSNPGCNTNGFPAKAGWDPVTGLGTPNFAKLLTAVGL